MTHGCLEQSFLRVVCLSSSFPLQVNDELKLSLRQSDYPVQLGLTGYTKKWAKGVEADMERRIHVEVPDQTTIGE